MQSEHEDILLRRSKKVGEYCLNKMATEGILYDHTKWVKVYDNSVESACGCALIDYSVEELAEMTYKQDSNVNVLTLNLTCCEKDEEHNLENYSDKKKLHLPWVSIRPSKIYKYSVRNAIIGGSS